MDYKKIGQVGGNQPVYLIFIENNPFIGMYRKGYYVHASNPYVASLTNGGVWYSQLPTSFLARAKNIQLCGKYMNAFRYATKSGKAVISFVTLDIFKEIHEQVGVSSKEFDNIKSVALGEKEDLFTNVENNAIEENLKAMREKLGLALNKKKVIKPNQQLSIPLPKDDMNPRKKAVKKQSAKLPPVVKVPPLQKEGDLPEWLINWWDERKKKVGNIVLFKTKPTKYTSFFFVLKPIAQAFGIQRINEGKLNLKEAGIEGTTTHKVFGLMSTAMQKLGLITYTKEGKKNIYFETKFNKSLGKPFRISWYFNDMQIQFKGSKIAEMYLNYILKDILKDNIITFNHE